MTQPLTIKEAIEVWADRWRTLKTWGAPVAAQLKVRQSSQRSYATGHCYAASQRIVVTVGADMPDGLTTVLHEFSHAVARDGKDRARHGLSWQAKFAAAVQEVTGLTVVEATEDYHVIHVAARDAMRTWWKASGNEFAWKLLSGK